MDTSALLHEALDAFQRQFGRAARFAAAAPGRVNLIGEHTDYNDGLVCPMAIERHTVIVADGTDSGKAAVISLDRPDDGEARFGVGASLAPGEPAWANYVRGVVAGFIGRGIDVGGFDAVIASSVPLGGGLASSASLEVATATLLEAMTGVTLEPAEKALLCQQAEHTFAGMPCGIMDQTISALGRAGHAMVLDCRSRETRMVPLNDPDVAVLICNTNVKHELVEGQYARRREQCERAAQTLGAAALRDVTLDQLGAAGGQLDDETLRRARHVVSEIARVHRFAEALEQRRWRDAGALMVESHASLRDDFEVSCTELDLAVELALSKRDSGVYGSRMTGGGFGGCTVSLVRRDAVDAVAEHIHDRYRRQTGIEPTIFATAAADGAHELML